MGSVNAGARDSRLSICVSGAMVSCERMHVNICQGHALGFDVTFLVWEITFQTGLVMS